MRLRTLLLSVFLGLLWLVLTGEYTVLNFILGMVLSFLLIIYSGTYTGISLKIKKIHKIIFLIFFFLFELILANIRVTFEILSPPLRMKPGIVKIPLSLDDNFQITLLANLITLTPGSLTLDVSEDKKFIYIHSMYIKDREKFISSIKNGFEKRIKEIFN